MTAADQAQNIPWYASVAGAAATAAIAWFTGRYRRKREEASTDASVTGLKALRQIIETLQSSQLAQAQEIERLRHSLSVEVSQIGRLRARVGHLEALLRTAGIAVPPDIDS